jgi:adenosine deaminase
MSSISAGSIAGPCASALNSLTPSQINFLQNLPKAELHAHLNGSIPINILQDLAREHADIPGNNDSEVVRTGLEQLARGIELKEINDFFGLFPAIYALTSTPSALARATRSVLQLFLDGPVPECTYLELRSTPRATPYMTRREYVEAVLQEIERFNLDANVNTGAGAGVKAALIVCLDRRMDAAVAKECVDIAVSMRKSGRGVVGVDLCGDPMVRCVFRLSMHFWSVTYNVNDYLDTNRRGICSNSLIISARQKKQVSE